MDDMHCIHGRIINECCACNKQEGIVIKEMSENDLKEMFESYEVNARLLGFKSTDEYEGFKHNASQGLIIFGGSFASILGELLAHSDMSNAAKIIIHWKAECIKHAHLYKLHLQKVRNETNTGNEKRD